MELGDVIFVIFLTENLISGWTGNISYTFASRWQFFGQKLFFSDLRSLEKAAGVHCSLNSNVPVWAER